MACTVAVEDTIVTHYTDQIREIIDQGKEEDYKELLQVSSTTLYYKYNCSIYLLLPSIATICILQQVGLSRCV